MKQTLLDSLISLESLFEKVIKIINNKTFKQFNYEKSN